MMLRLAIFGGAAAMLVLTGCNDKLPTGRLSEACSVETMEPTLECDAALEGAGVILSGTYVSKAAFAGYNTVVTASVNGAPETVVGTIPSSAFVPYPGDPSLIFESYAVPSAGYPPIHLTNGDHSITLCFTQYKSNGDFVVEACRTLVIPISCFFGPVKLTPSYACAIEDPHHAGIKMEGKVQSPVQAPIDVVVKIGTTPSVEETCAVTPVAPSPTDPAYTYSFTCPAPPNPPAIVDNGSYESEVCFTQEDHPGHLQQLCKKITLKPNCYMFSLEPIPSASCDTPSLASMSGTLYTSNNQAPANWTLLLDDVVVSSGSIGNSPSDFIVKWSYYRVALGVISTPLPAGTHKISICFTQPDTDPTLPAHTLCSAKFNVVAPDLQTDPNNCGACGNVCSAIDACHGAGPCVGGVCTNPPKSCDDGDLCTTDSCQLPGGCVHTPKTCSAADACHQAGTCQPDGTCSNPPRVCDDGEPCTSDACVLPTGCVFTPISCPGGGECCAGMCIDVLTDPLNCGACGNVCPGGHACINGVCDTNCVPTIVPNPFGVATDYNLFVAGDLLHVGGDSEGAIAVGGSANIRGFGGGTKLPPGGNAQGYGLVVGHNLQMQDVQIYGGNVYVGGTLVNVNQSGTILHGSLITPPTPSPIDFAATFTLLTQLSEYIATLPANGIVTANPYSGRLTLDGGDQAAAIIVFTITPALWQAAREISLERIRPTSTVVINVPVLSDDIPYFGGMFAQDSSAWRRTVWNFPLATSLRHIGVGWQGSILAPKADFRYANGNIDGQLIVKSVIMDSWSAQVHDFRFLGNLPVCL